MIVDEFDRWVGQRVMYFRAFSQTSRETLAKRIGYRHRNSIEQIEQGDARLPVWAAVRICEYLGIKLDLLLSDDLITPPHGPFSCQMVSRDGRFCGLERHHEHPRWHAYLPMKRPE